MSSLPPTTASPIPGTDWVPETAFGKWFLSTSTWFKYVLTQAIVDLKNLAGERGQQPRRLLDIGCGQGLAFAPLAEHFRPEQIIGVDVDPHLLNKAEHKASQLNRNVRVLQSSVTALNLPDESVDVVFCHQLLHHVAKQERALQELYRILTPGGLLLVSESCKSFIDSWAVRWFFRHPMHVQKSSLEYQQLLRAMGFEFSAADVGETVPWWSLPDFGVARRLGWSRGPFDTTELLVVATKPKHP